MNPEEIYCMAKSKERDATFIILNAELYSCTTFCNLYTSVSLYYILKRNKATSKRAICCGKSTTCQCIA